MKFLVKLQSIHFLDIGLNLTIIVQPYIVVQIEVTSQPITHEHNKLMST
jgi:hypothetical protein